MVVRRAAWALLLSFVGCGPSGQEPLVAPGPLPSIGSAEPVVVCPAGSTYDAAKQVCLAQQEVPEPEPEPEPKPVTPAVPAGAVRVTCSFANGWVSVLPAAKYPRDDQFLMQALIGLTEEPGFWVKEREWAPFAKWKATKCNGTGQSFDVPKGSYFILAGEAGTFGARGQYTRNGFKKKMDLDPESPKSVELKSSDLTHTWVCISCPWVSFFDPGGESEGPAQSSRGAYLPSFVVLRGRRSKEEHGTDRVAASVPVKDGRVRLRVIEAEHEVTHLDRLTIEIAGKAVLPSPGARSALASADGVEVEMARGRMIEVTFEVPGVADGTYPGVVIATGHYEPTAD